MICQIGTCSKCGSEVLGRRKGVPLKYCSKACRYACNVGRKRLPDDVKKARKRATAAAWAVRTRDAQKVRRRAYVDNNREAVSDRNRRLKYGISGAETRAMLEAQSGGCAVCREAIRLVGEKSSPGLAHVDHDHATGQVRGLLCRGCNWAIGQMKDSPSRLRAAAAYLEKRQPKLRLA